MLRAGWRMKKHGRDGEKNKRKREKKERKKRKGGGERKEGGEKRKGKGWKGRSAKQQKGERVAAKMQGVGKQNCQGNWGKP